MWSQSNHFLVTSTDAQINWATENVDEPGTEEEHLAPVDKQDTCLSFLVPVLLFRFWTIGFSPGTRFICNRFQKWTRECANFIETVRRKSVFCNF